MVSSGKHARNDGWWERIGRVSGKSVLATGHDDDDIYVWYIYIWNNLYVYIDI